MRAHNHGIDEAFFCRETVINGLILGDCMKKRRWSVKRWKTGWGVFDRGICHDTFPTLADAHTFATQCAVIDIFLEDGGLFRLRRILELESVCRQRGGSPGGGQMNGCTCKECMHKTKMLDKQMWARRKAMFLKPNTDDDVKGFSEFLPAL